MKMVKACSFYWCQKIVILMLLFGASTAFAQHKTVAKKVFKVPQRACVLEPIISDARIEKMKKEASNEDDFYIVADDVNYYLYQAGEFMKRQGQKAILVPATYTDILFPNGEIIQADTIAFGSMILYKPGKNPQVISSVDFAEAYKSYFAPVKGRRRR